MRSEPVVWLWRFVRSMPESGRRGLLRFVTGSSAPPARGFAWLKGYNGALHPFTVRKVAPVANNHASRLPRGQTCFNTLHLPAYATEAELRSTLRAVLESADAQGFDEAAF